MGAALLWAGIVALLTRSTRRKWTGADGKFIGSTVGILALLTVIIPFLPLDLSDAAVTTVGAYFAGTVLALLFAATMAIRGFKGQAHPPSAATLRTRSLAAFALGSVSGRLCHKQYPNRDCPVGRSCPILWSASFHGAGNYRAFLGKPRRYGKGD